MAALIATASCVSGDDTTELAVWTVEGGVLATRTWDSGKTDNLSPWKSIDCYTSYGSEWLLTGLHAWKDSGSADDFIAKLGGKCSAYVDSVGRLLQDGRHETDEIFSANHVLTGAWTEVTPMAFVSQVEFEMLAATGDVQAIRLDQVELTSVGTLGNASPTAWVGATDHPLSGPTVALECPTGDVVTGLALRYDTATGKIRTLRVTCRPLQHASS